MTSTVDEVFVCASEQAREIKREPKARGLAITTTGSPTLNTWADVAANVTAAREVMVMVMVMVGGDASGGGDSGRVSVGVGDASGSGGDACSVMHQKHTGRRTIVQMKGEMSRECLR